MPINCSAYTYTSDPPPSASGVLPSSGGTSLGRSYTTHQDRSRAVARTCECLTQTLCCHGCGGGVGYMIVSPCQRCTSSITATNRTTNGHRFVFYSSEITACERHYVAGESGVIPHVPPIPPMPGFPPPHPPTGVQYIAAQGTSSPTFDYIPVSSPESERSLSPSASNNPSGHSTPELTAGFTAISLSPRRDHQHYAPGSRSINDSLRSTHRQHHQTPPSPPAPPPSYAASPRNWESPHLAPYIPDARITPITIPAESPYEPLKPGDVLYWNHLVRSGEIPGVMEDPRARGSSSTTPLDSKRSSIDSRATSPLSASTRNASSKVRRLAGR